MTSLVKVSLSIFLHHPHQSVKVSMNRGLGEFFISFSASSMVYHFTPFTDSDFTGCEKQVVVTKIASSNIMCLFILICNKLLSAQKYVINYIRKFISGFTLNNNRAVKEFINNDLFNVLHRNIFLHLTHSKKQTIFYGNNSNFSA